MPIELIILIASLIIAWLVFTALLNIIKTSVKTAVIVSLIILILNYAFGITYQEVWLGIINLPTTIWNFFVNR
jgi:hypothetical protein